MKIKTTIVVFLFTLFLMTSSKVNAIGLSNCTPPTASVYIDINNVRAMLLNGGDMWWDVLSTGMSAYEIPKGSGLNTAYASSLWLSALDEGGNIHTASQTYRQRGFDFWPGPLDSYGYILDKTCKAWDKMYSVYGIDIKNIKNGVVSESVKSWPASYAPFKDIDGDGIYNPLNGDFPVFDLNNTNNIPGQMVWWVINDKGNSHSAVPNKLPLSVEIQCTAFAYSSNTSAIINNSTMYRYKIINKSTNILYDFKFGNFVDVELGGADDDYIGCDVSRNLFYVYNADNFDASSNASGYGKTPPSFGIQYLKTLKNTNGVETGSSAFNSINKGPIGMYIGFPYDSLSLNNYLNGFWNNGQPITYGTPTGYGGTLPTKYIYSGDLFDSTAWVETNVPGDRKMLSVMGNNINLLPGGVQEVVIAAVWARADSSLNETNKHSVKLLQYSADTLKVKFANNFEEFWTGIEEEKISARVFPNPTTEKLFVELNKSHMDFSVEVYSVDGKKVYESNYKNTSKIELNTSAFSNGIYLIKIISFKSEFVSKFIKK